MKSIKKAYKYLIVATSIAGMSLWGGCDEDPFNLKLEPISTITDVSYWSVPSQWEAFANGIHSRFRTHQLNFQILGEYRGGTMGKENYPGHTRSYQEIIDNNLAEVRPGITNYGGFYTNINQINLLIDKTMGGDADGVLTESEKNWYLGQAYGLRAFYYFHLVRSWGDVVLQTEPSYSFDIGGLSKPQSPTSEVMNLVKEDIDRSLSRFEDYSFVKGKTQWSKAASQMLKAEYYLWTAHRGGGSSDARIAKEALEDVKNNIPSLRLMEDFHDIFDQDSKDNDEIILAIRNDQDEYTLLGGAIHLMITRDRYTTPGYGFDSLRQRNITHDLYNIHSRGGTFSIVMNEDLFRSYSPKDYRKWATGQAIWHVVDGDTVMYVGGVWCNKFQGEIISGIRSWYNDYPIYRYADLLLLLAEAKYLMDEDPATEINLVRERGFGDNYKEEVYGYPNQAIDSKPDYAILRERFFEFVYEGKRWYDLRRFGDDYVLEFTEANPNKLLWPIDQGTLTDNAALKQTPGY
jgi:starch-binding outer membrane protein, SusD/RagB family